LPQNDIEQLLKDLDCEESIPKLKENGITTELFWQLQEPDFEKMLDVKVFGTRKKLLMRLGEIS